MLNKCLKYPLQPKTLCQPFYSFIGSILCYGSEVSGFSKSKKVERIHLTFCKRILKLKTYTCSAGVYGDLGRYPGFIAWYAIFIRYWCKIVNNDNMIVKSNYNQALNDFEKCFKNWESNTKELLREYGFLNVFALSDPVRLKSFHIIFLFRTGAAPFIKVHH